MTGSPAGIGSNEENSVDQLGVDQPSTHQLGADQPRTSQPSTNQPGLDRLDIPGVEWRRVSPKLIWVELVGAIGMLVVVIAIGVLMFVLHVWWIVLAIAVVAIAAIINIAFTRRRVRSIGYQLREDDLLFRRGIMWQRFVAVPYGRMQLVDINRGPIARWLGLSELKFVTAAAAAGVTIPGLPESEAESLRDHLVSVAESRRSGL
jgi:membrane protein YdbS with pleckstrin-like domain